MTKLNLNQKANCKAVVLNGLRILNDAVMLEASGGSGRSVAYLTLSSIEEFIKLYLYLKGETHLNDHKKKFSFMVNLSLQINKAMHGFDIEKACKTMSISSIYSKSEEVQLKKALKRLILSITTIVKKVIDPTRLRTELMYHDIYTHDASNSSLPAILERSLSLFLERSGDWLLRTCLPLMKVLLAYSEFYSFLIDIELPATELTRLYPNLFRSLNKGKSPIEQ